MTREDLYRYISAKYLAEARQPVDYFEFGVFEGESIKYWADLNRHAESRFFGFDSFEGLPEAWNRDNPAGFYSAHGKLPETDDRRIEFIVGWFQKSMPAFLAAYQPKNPLVIHSDSDLYSSTLYSLTAMNAYMVPGTIIIFDEFYDPLPNTALCRITPPLICVNTKLLRPLEITYKPRFASFSPAFICRPASH